MSPQGEHQATLRLVSMPWPLLNRPSIQLGVLKAYIERETSHRVATHHPYLQIALALGTRQYSAIAESSWGAEALFAALLFPEQRSGASRTFSQTVTDRAHLAHPFDELLPILASSCRGWLQTIPWTSCRLIGFSLCFNQLFASLYLASLLKELPDCPPIVFGGSLCGGELGRSLLSTFPQIDYVIDGEGEGPLAGLLDQLTGQAPSLPERVACGACHAVARKAPELNDLNTLPIPDYQPYFAEVRQLFPDAPFIPVIPVEFSRGCWWNRCSFCNLNLQWCGYRHKTSTTMLAEVTELARRHQCLDFSFTDNALPPQETDGFFAELAAGPLDYRFFAEIRAVPDPEKLALYRQGGLDTIQVGIEALSSSLLKKMRKGTSTIVNIAMLKAAQAADIRLEGNLIMEFPGSTPSEVEETLNHLQLVLPYLPLAPATFFLGHGSPVAAAPKEYGILAVTAHPHASRLLPPEIRGRLTMLIKGYRGDRQRQRQLWQPVRDALSCWQGFHTQRAGRAIPPLSFRDGGTFLVIRQEIPDGPTLHHRLRGTSRDIYLFCQTIRTISDITNRFSTLTESAIRAFLQQLVEKKLLFREEDRVLSLAVQQR